ncbi:hypothetical protein [Qipengyuania sp. SM2507]|nr:hypothetical protein [Alphaproteobacteria bacterium]
MGRSVSYPSGAIAAFRLMDEPDDGWDWGYEFLVDDVVDTARLLFPSLQLFDGWRGGEDRILLRKAFADCGVSIYCGLAAIWLVERDDAQYWEADSRQARSGCARQWLAQVSDRFTKAFGDLRLVGRFSNGEAIFERVGSSP